MTTRSPRYAKTTVMAIRSFFVIVGVTVVVLVFVGVISVVNEVVAMLLV